MPRASLTSRQVGGLRGNTEVEDVGEAELTRVGEGEDTAMLELDAGLIGFEHPGRLHKIHTTRHALPLELLARDCRVRGGAVVKPQPSVLVLAAGAVRRINALLSTPRVHNEHGLDTAEARALGAMATTLSCRGR